MEDTDGGLHPAVDGPRLDEDEDEVRTGWGWGVVLSVLAYSATSLRYTL